MVKKQFCSNKTEKKTLNKNYFRYESPEGVKQKLEVGEVISRFKLESIGTDTWLVFGYNGKRSLPKPTTKYTHIR